MRFEDKFEPTYILTIAGFMERFDQIGGSHNGTGISAYEAVEAEVIAKFNHRKYANYDSFRNSRARWLKAQRKSKKENKPGRLAA